MMYEYSTLRYFPYLTARGTGRRRRQDRHREPKPKLKPKLELELELRPPVWTVHVIMLDLGASPTV